MPQQRKFSEHDRGRAIAWLQDGVSIREVARRLLVTHSVICRLQARFQQTGSTAELHRSGRPRSTTAREDRFIEHQALTMRKVPANEVRRRLRVPTNTNVSNQTVRNRLRGIGLRARRPLRRPRLTQAHRAARRVWAGQNRRWTRQDWANVLFTDESRFLLEPDDRRIRVWRRQGERFTDDCIQERAAFGGGSVMV